MFSLQWFFHSLVKIGGCCFHIEWKSLKLIIFTDSEKILETSVSEKFARKHRRFVPLQPVLLSWAPLSTAYPSSSDIKIFESKFKNKRNLSISEIKLLIRYFPNNPFSGREHVVSIIKNVNVCSKKSIFQLKSLNSDCKTWNKSMDTENPRLLNAIVDEHLARYQVIQLKNLIAVILVTILAMVFNYKVLSISLLIIILGLVIFILSNEFIRVYRSNQELTALLQSERFRNSQ